MKIDKNKKAIEWFQTHEVRYSRLVTLARSTLENLLVTSSIQFLSVTGRTKSLKSYSDKFEKKQYKNPETEVTDIAGIRVITYIEADAARVCEIIKKGFHVHDDKSSDRATELNVDRVGYRSIHFVCDLGPERSNLPEYSHYKDVLFEIQVRTVLQHAWAEIEHDRNYKFSGTLPTMFQRRLNILAGVLELADREFDTLANDIDEYSKDVAKATTGGRLDIELNSTSLTEYLRLKLPALFSKIGYKEYIGNGPNSTELVGELRAFGINTLQDLDQIMTEAHAQLIEKYSGVQTDLGIVRSVMMLEDVHKYFEEAWQEHWASIDTDTFEMLKQEYGTEEMKKLINKNQLIEIDENGPP